MRSRYSAFALGLGDYLLHTLSSDHEDRRAPREQLVTALSRAKDRQRFMGLTILRAEGDRVLFFAKVFERGADRSFMELSTFVREDGAWRYASGLMLPRAQLPSHFESLDEEQFSKLVEDHQFGGVGNEQ